MRHFKPFKLVTNSSKTFPLEIARYFKFAARESCLVRDEMYFSWMVNHGAKSIVDIPHENVIEYYMDKSALVTYKKTANFIAKNWRAHLKNYRKRKERLLNSTRKLSSSTKTNNRNEILKWYEKYIDEAYDFCEYVMGAWGIIYHIEPVVQKHFSKNMETIVALERPIEFIKMKWDMTKFTPEHVHKKYSWVKGYSLGDKLYTLSEIKRIQKTTTKPEAEKQKKAFANNRKNFRKFIASTKDPKLKLFANIVHEYAYLKTERIDAWKQTMFLIRPFFEYLTTQIPGSSLKETRNLSSQEITRLLKYNEAPPLPDLKKRSQERAFYVFQKNKITISYDASLLRKTYADLQKHDQNQTALHGTSACKGVARGKVKIIGTTKDLQKIRIGDIFVAKFTHPTFTPAMAKAGAIVTDEGGITSHAAIVSRELGIPCIIGTKVATKILKDGDLVEVDANKGVVRKL